MTDRVALKALFSEAAATGWSLQSDIQLLGWLEGFAESLKGRTNAVADEVQQVVEEMGAVELNLQNTFNSFRCLSSFQFVENRVYEEDETEVISAGPPKTSARQSPMPTESYEDEIVPRYKDAVKVAWAAFQKGSSQRDQSAVGDRSQNELRDSHQNNRIQILPHIIGTEAFTRESHCGLAGLSGSHKVTDNSESETDVDREGPGLAAEVVGTGILSEGEWSGSSSDASPYPEAGLEPAVSAALDFKAMLEAALRNPSGSSDGSTWDDTDNGIVQVTKTKYSPQRLPIDGVSNHSRTISRTMERNDDEVVDSTYDVSDTNVNNDLQPPTNQHSAEIHAQSKHEGSSVQIQPLLPVQGTATHPLVIEELLKTPYTSQAQAMLNQEYKQLLDSIGGYMQVGSSGFSHSPSILAEVFDGKENDAKFQSKKHGVLLNSNTGPTIPDRLFQNQKSFDASPQTRAESGRSNSVNSSQKVVSSQAPLVSTARGPADQNLDKLSQDFEKKESADSQLASLPSLLKYASRHTRTDSEASNVVNSSPVMLNSPTPLMNPERGPSDQDLDKLSADFEREDSDDSQFGSSPPVPKHANEQSARSSFSSGSNVNVGPQQAGPLQIRGGLFDDDDEEDEDAGDLFGASTVRAERQPVAQHQDSPSSKGLFDESEADIPNGQESLQDVNTRTPKEEGASQQRQTQSDSASLHLSEYEIESGSGADNLQRQTIDSIHAVASLKITDVNLRVSNGVQYSPSDESREQRHAQLPMQSILAATLKSIAPLAVDADDDSWSSSEGDDDNSRGEQAVRTENIIQGSTLGLLQTRDTRTSSSLGGGVVDIKQAVSVESDHFAQGTLSTENTSPVSGYVWGENSSISSHVADEGPPVVFPQAISRSLSSSGALLGKVAIKMDESPLLQSNEVKLSDADQSDDGDDSMLTQSHNVGQSQLVRKASSQTEGPSGHQAPFSSQATGLVNDMLISSEHNSVEAKNRISEGAGTSRSDLAVPVNEFGRLTGRRAFASLFEEDDAEGDLFRQASPKHPGGFLQGTGQHQSWLSSDSSLMLRQGGGARIVESGSPLESPDMKPKTSELSNPSTGPTLDSDRIDGDNEGDLFAVKSSSKLSVDINKEGGDLSSTKPSPNLSSLLFGDDDEDDENALFGPLGGRASRRNNGLKPGKPMSLFDDADLPSTSRRAMRGSSLFDD